MKNTLKACLIAAPLLVSLSGCVISVDGDGFDGHNASWEDRQHKNRRIIADLDLDISAEQVKSRLGVPDFNELIKRDNDVYQVLFYRTHRERGDGKTTKEECTPLVLKNGALVGWGDKAYHNI